MFSHAKVGAPGVLADVRPERDREGVGCHFSGLAKNDDIFYERK